MNSPRWLALASCLLTVAVLHAQLPTINSFTVESAALPVGGQPTFSWSVTNASTIRISPGVGGLAATGSVTLPASGLVTLLGSGDVWKYLDTGDDLGPSDQPNTAAAWFNSGYNDSAWLSRPTPLSYGNNDLAIADQSTDLRYGTVPTDDPLHPNNLNDATNKLPTYYFRTKFPVSAQQITETQALFVTLRRDDGAVVYLNGAEVFRHNLAVGPVDNATLATVTVGAEKATYFRMAVPKSALIAGTNTLAVEVHQAVVTSSDIMMDVRVEAIIPGSPTFILNPGSAWKYLDDGSNQGTLWRTAGFVDTSWAAGPGTLGYNNSLSNATGTTAGTNTLANFGPDANNKINTTYFRKKFTAANVSSFTDFLISANYDDGMVIYLNGSEIARAFMPATGDISFSTLATNHEGDFALPGVVTTDPDILVADPASIRAAMIQGENILAVELHQSAANSSDLSFNLQFQATDGVTSTMLIKPFAAWRFLDTGDDLGTYDGSGFNANLWVSLAFSETGWKRGFAEIGFGDPNDVKAPATGIDYGDDLAAKRITSYFRRTVAIPNLANFSNLTFDLFRDDAAAVYINGTEVFRDTTLPAGATSTTPATAAGNATLTRVVPKTAFVAGNNLIAVEVHQESGGSSDVFFDLSLYDNVLGNSRVYTLTADNATGSVSQNVTVTSVPLSSNPVTLMTSLLGGVSTEPSWNTPYVWSDRLAPTADKDYEVLTSFARVLVTGDGAANARFSGRSLKLGLRAILILNNSDGAAAVCDDLRLAGGELQSSFNGTAGTLQTRALTGAINVQAPSLINPSGLNRELEIASTLSGSGSLTIASNNPAAGAVDLPSSVVISGDNSAFTGNWEVSSRPFRIGHPNALGGTVATPNTLTLHSGYMLDPDADIVAPNTSVILRNTGGANPSIIALDQNLRFQALSFVIDPNSEPLPDGIYTYATLTATQQAYFVDGPGTLTIGAGGGGAGDSDADGLPDAWELANLGTLTFGPTQDPDADRYSNLAEYKLGTQPRNGSSFYKFTGPEAIISGGIPSIRLILPAQPGWSLRTQWTTNLQTGQWQNLGPALTGSSSYTVIDNGAQSGTPPFTAGAPTRFYRVQITVP